LKLVPRFGGQFLIYSSYKFKNQKQNYGTRFARGFLKAKAPKFAPFGMLCIFRYDAKGSLSSEKKQTRNFYDAQSLVDTRSVFTD
jgi:hypothetical protein